MIFLIDIYVLYNQKKTDNKRIFFYKKIDVHGVLNLKKIVIIFDTR
jgi:hypothetical protein